MKRSGTLPSFVRSVISRSGSVSMSGTIDSEGRLVLSVEITNIGTKPHCFGFDGYLEGSHLNLYNLDGSEIRGERYFGAKETSSERVLAVGESFSVTVLGMVTPVKIMFYHPDPFILNGETVIRYQHEFPLNGQPVEIEFDLYGVKSNRLTLDPINNTLTAAPSVTLADN